MGNHPVTLCPAGQHDLDVVGVMPPSPGRRGHGTCRACHRERNNRWNRRRRAGDSDNVMTAAAADGDVTLTAGAWTGQALCAQSDPEAWFPAAGADAAPALRVCARCPVRAQCLELALSGADTWDGISTGIWGGTTPRQRSVLRRRLRAAS